MVVEWYCKKKKKKVKVLEKNGGRLVSMGKNMKFFQPERIFNLPNEYSICSYDCCQKEFKIISMVRDMIRTIHYGVDHTNYHEFHFNFLYSNVFYIFFHFFIVQ